MMMLSFVLCKKTIDVLKNLNLLVLCRDDAYTRQTMAVKDIKFEEACILYNIGALHSILGGMDNRTTPEVTTHSFRVNEQPLYSEFIQVLGILNTWQLLNCFYFVGTSPQYDTMQLKFLNVLCNCSEVHFEAGKRLYYES